MSLKLSQISSGGPLAPSTDQLVAVRSGSTDVLVTPGAAATKSVSDNTQTTLAAVSGSITMNHVAQFADASGTIQDGGVLGTAASKSSSSSSSTVASVSGGTTIGHVAVFSDIAGTIQDGGSISGTYVTQSTTVNGHALSSNVVVSASDITTGTLPVAQLPVATSSAEGIVKPDNSTITISGGVISSVGSGVSYVASNGTASAASDGFAGGPGAAASTVDSVAIGASAVTGGAAAIAIGLSASGGAASAVAIGQSTTANHTNATVIGSNLASATGNDVIIGNTTYAIKVNGANGNTTVPTGGVLLTTTASLTNGAASNAGTLTNAPAVGNPTKWIPINDNGTTRYIPAW